MKIVGCDLHARQQSIALLDTETGELVERSLEHGTEQPRGFYSSLSGPVVVGIEASGAMQWFLQLMEELEIECRVGHPAKIRAAEARKQKHDRRDALLLLQLLLENRFPTIWMPTTEQRDLRTLLRDRHQWVRMRTRVQSTYTAQRRNELQRLYAQLQKRIEELNQQADKVIVGHPQAQRLLTHPGAGPVTALATEVFLGDPRRFENGKAVASYIGMIPCEDSSGPQQRFGQLSKQGNALLRYLWCEAAMHAVSKDGDLKRFYGRKLV